MPQKNSIANITLPLCISQKVNTLMCFELTCGEKGFQNSDFFFYLDAYLFCPLDLLQAQIPRFVVAIVLLFVFCLFVFCFDWLVGVFFVFVFNFLKNLEHILK